MAKYNLLHGEDKDTIRRLSEYYHRFKKINMGCGRDIRGDFLNIDFIEDLADIDLAADLTKCDFNFFSDNSADEIIAYDVIEHFTFNEVGQVLKWWNRLLVPGGRFIVRVPDLTYLAKRLLAREIPAFEAQRLIYGGQVDHGDFHKSGYTGDYLEGLLYGCGYSKIIQRIEGQNDYPPSHNVTLVAIK